MLVAAFCAYCPPSVVARKASSPTPQSTAQPQQGETLADPLFTDLLTPTTRAATHRRVPALS